MTDNPTVAASGEHQELRDERPSWACTQTFFRNHEVIGRALRSACAARPERLRILDVGGGVLEPLLVAALCELVRDAGALRHYEIHCVDLSADVCEILERLRRRESGEVAGHQVINSQGWLNLPGLAQIFGATHADVNSWLIDPVALSGQLQRWIDLGVAGYLGIPPDVCHSTERMTSFIANGLAVPQRLLDHVRVAQGDVGAVDPPLFDPEWADVVLSNYATQYPIWDGKGEQVIHNIESAMSAAAVVQIANSYSAQRELLALIDTFGRKLAGAHLELLLRELFVVAQYTNDAPDAPPRLVPRADALFAPGIDHPAGVRTDAVQRLTRTRGGAIVAFGSLQELSALMATHDGRRAGSNVLWYARWDPKDRHGSGCLLPREVLLSFGRNPMHVGGLFAPSGDEDPRNTGQK